MTSTFLNCSAFTFNLTNLNNSNTANMSSVGSMANMLAGATSFGTANYSALLVHLNNYTTRNGVVLVTSSKLRNQLSVIGAKESLKTIRGWSITDLGVE